MSRKSIDLATYIDQTCLRPDVSISELIEFCSEAKDYGFKSVCIPPFAVSEIEGIMRSSDTVVCTVIGFPLGYSSTKSKLQEIKEAMEDGAEELDVVINQSWLKSGSVQALKDEMLLLNDYVQARYGTIKWIVETAHLSAAERNAVCTYCLETGADFIKTSTGFAKQGAKLQDIKAWTKIIKDSPLEIKASGGIKTMDQALKFIEAGATRLGCSAGVNIVKEWKACIE